MPAESACLAHIARYIEQQQAAATSPWAVQQTQALKKLLDQGLPTLQDEAYRRTPLTRKLGEALPYAAPKPSVTTNWQNMPVLPFAQEAICVRLLNNQPPPEGLFQNLPKGLHISSLAEAYDSHKALLKAHAFSSPLQKEDNYVTLNEAAFEYGVFVYVAPKVEIEQPLLLQQQAEGPSVSHPRFFVYLDKGASLRLIDVQSSQGEGPMHQNSVCEIICAEEAELSLCKLQDESPHMLRIDHSYVSLAQKAVLHSCCLSSGAALLRNNLYVKLQAEEARAHLKSLYLPHAHAHIDNHSTLDHCSPQSYSEQNYKGVLSGRGRAVFNGRIFMRPGAAQSTAYQANKNLLLSPQAKVHTKPQLEIWVDDVRCSHGCTVGQLSSEERNYLQSRGISKALAEEMLLAAFAEEIFSDLPEAAFVTYLRDWLKAQFQHMVS